MYLMVFVALLATGFAYERIPMRRIESPRQRMTREGEWESFHRHQERMEIFHNIFRGGSGNVGEKTQVDFQYLADVEVGTPSQKFSVVPDTGSPVFWLVDKTCGHGGSACAAGCVSFFGMCFCFGGQQQQSLASQDPCAGKNKYDSSASSTYQKDGKKFHIGYGDGSSTSGFYGRDTVTFAGVSVTSHVAQANTLSQRFAFSKLDGILGLSWPQLNVEFNHDDTLPVVTGDMKAQGVLAANVFAVYMDENGGELHLGGIDNSKFSGSINYVPVTKKGFWQFNVDSVSINGRRVGGGGAAISDTGTSAIVVPNNMVADIASALGVTQFDRQQGLYKMDCDTRLPNIDFAIDGKTFSIPVEHYKFNLPQQGCYVGVSGGGGGGGGNPDFILGDCFIRTYYSIYDTDNARVGFAEH